MNELESRAASHRLAAHKLESYAIQACSDLRQQADALEAEAKSAPPTTPNDVLVARAVLRAINNIMPRANGIDPGIADILTKLGFEPHYVETKQQEWAADPARCLLRMDAGTLAKFLEWAGVAYHD